MQSRHPILTGVVGIGCRCYETLPVSVRWRRERDSNPRRCYPQRFSRPSQSTTLPSLLWLRAAKVRIFPQSCKSWADARPWAESTGHCEIATLSVLPTLDWAAEVAQCEDVAIVSGFHSKMEREVLDFLLRGKGGIICVLARSMYKKIPDKFSETFNFGRILFIAPFKTTATMTSHLLCQRRNEYVASLSEELVFSSLTPVSSLYHLSITRKTINII